MKVIVLKNVNLNAIKINEWNSFCEYIGSFVEAYAKFSAHTATINVSKDGETAVIKFHVNQRESLQTVTAKFDKFLCKSWTYQNFDRNIINVPTSNVSLSWQVFLTKVFGDEYKTELDNFYKKNNISTSLIKVLIKNSNNSFDF